jgi:porin
MVASASQPGPKRMSWYLITLGQVEKSRCGVLALAMMASGAVAHAQDAAEELAGPDAVSTRLAEDAKDKPDLLNIDEEAGLDAWKARVKNRTGLDFGVDYNWLGFAATKSLGEDAAASGAFRIFGAWELFQQGTKNSGSIVFKIENRHAFTDVAPNALGVALGYAGLVSSVFNDDDWRATHVFWQQRFAQGRRGWDSNPRYGYPHNGFRVLRFSCWSVPCCS